MGERQQLNILHPSCQNPALTVFPRKLSLPLLSFDHCFMQPAAVMLRLLQSGKRVLMLGDLWLPRSGVSFNRSGPGDNWDSQGLTGLLPGPLSLCKVMPALVRLQEQRHSKVSQYHFSSLDLFLAPHTSTTFWLGLLSKWLIEGWNYCCSTVCS